MSDEIREQTDEDFARAIPQRQRERIIRGRIDPEKDIVALRRFAGLTREEFAEANPLRWTSRWCPENSIRN